MKHDTLAILLAILLCFPALVHSHWDAVEPSGQREWSIGKGELIEEGEYIKIYNKGTELEWEVRIESIETFRDGSSLLILFSALLDEVFILEIAGDS